MQVRTQDVPRFVQDIARASDDSRNQAWEFVQTNFDTLGEKGGGGPDSQRKFASRVAAGVAGTFHTQVQYDQVEAFFRSKFPTEWDTVRSSLVFAVQALEQITQNIFLSEQLIPSACEWLQPAT